MCRPPLGGEHRCTHQSKCQRVHKMPCATPSFCLSARARLSDLPTSCRTRARACVHALRNFVRPDFCIHRHCARARRVVVHCFGPRIICADRSHARCAFAIVFVRNLYALCLPTLTVEQYKNKPARAHNMIMQPESRMHPPPCKLCVLLTETA